MALSGTRTPKIAVSGEDSVDVLGMVPNADVYCGYIAGSYANYAAVVKAFPKKKYVAIVPGLNMAAKWDAFDVEPGNATAADAPSAFAEWKHNGPLNTNRPMFYADRASAGYSIGEVESALTRAGITRDEYGLWIADPNGQATIPPGYDAIQWQFDGTHDNDAFYSDLFGERVPLPGTGLARSIMDRVHAETLAITILWGGTLASGTHMWEVQLQALSRANSELWMPFAQAASSQPQMTIRGLQEGWHYRYRIYGGTWSGWVNLTTNTNDVIVSLPNPGLTSGVDIVEWLLDQKTTQGDGDERYQRDHHHSKH